MKKRIFAAVMALCLMSGTSAFAQDATKDQMPRQKMTAEQMAQKKTDKMKEALKLNDEQTKQVYAHNLQQVKDMQAHREQMRAAHKAEMEKMKSVLTPEQYEQWKQMQGPEYGKHHGMKGKDCKGSCDKKDMKKKM